MRKKPHRLYNWATQNACYLANTHRPQLTRPQQVKAEVAINYGRRRGDAPVTTGG